MLRDCLAKLLSRKSKKTNQEVKTEEINQPANDVIHSPIKGKFVNLSDAKDPVFVSGALGDGFAVEFDHDSGVVPVFSPVEGVVEMLFATKHAVTIKAKNNALVFIHIGIDTVKLDGQGFESVVKQGDKVKVGEVLVNVDLDLVHSKGYTSDVHVTVLPESNYKAVKFLADRSTSDTVVLSEPIAEVELNK
ncbi:PTS sugar transporter subunit IIA [Mycoplasma sp. 394]